MAKVFEFEGMAAVQHALSREARRKLGLKGDSPSVIVGYTQNYAIYVHENLENHHPVGQAKFLEQPSRELKKVLPEVVRQAVKGGATLAKGLFLAGLRLQRASQELVPVDTGALKGSAFTRLEE